VQERTAQELSRLDKLDRRRPRAVDGGEGADVAAAQNVPARMEQLRGQFERWREQKTEGKPEQHLEPQRGSPTETKQEMQRAGPEPVADSPIAQGRQAFREPYEAYKQAKEPVVVPEPKQEQALEKVPEKAL
jgi:hypothetical protein